jgi:hypothetical protein
LRAEAGHGIGAIIVLFHTSRQRWSSGKTVLAFLTLSPVAGVEALCWNIGLPGRDPFSCSSATQRNALMDLLHACAGPPMEAVDYWLDVPTDDELRELEAY